MADQKISAMTSASSVAGADVTPIVQSGANKKATFTIIKDFLATFFAQVFTDLTDVPSSYSGGASKVVSVKSDESGLEFTTPTSITTGNLTDSGTDGIVVTGGTGAVVGSGTSLAQHVADASHNGYLSQTDWSTFNGKSTVAAFTDLTDVPASYAGQGEKIVYVLSGENGLGFITPTTSGVSQLISGGGVAWTGTGFNYIISAAIYAINGVQYTSAQTPVTLAAADPTQDRIDVFYVNTSSVAGVITGTPGTPPVQPSVDPGTQLQLTFAYVVAASTTPVVTNVDIYLENTEYTMSTNAGTINLASTNNPYAGTKDIEGTATVSGNLITALKPSGTLDLSGYTQLTLQIRSKASWPSPKSISIFWMNGASVVGASQALKNGTFGFDSSITASYQQIVIPIANFGTGTNAVDRLRMTVSGGGSSIGWYIDNIILQAGGGGGGGGGTVTNFSAGALSPLFTTTVATPTTTPALGFVLTNAGANTYLGNATGGGTSPSYTAAGSLTKTDDTNITLTLGGNPTTSLLRSTSLTLGWTGTLSVGRGGTGVGSLGNLTDAGTDGIVVTGGTGSVITNVSLAQQASDATHNGYLSSSDWSTFNGKVSTSRTLSTTAPLTGGGDLSANRTFAITQSGVGTDGYLSSTDWNTFNNKQSTLTIGNLTDVGTDGITVTGGTGAVVGSGTALSQHVADATHNGYLSSTDWTAFNGAVTGAGVSSFNTRTGTVTSLNTDYRGVPTTYTASFTIADTTEWILYGFITLQNNSYITIPSGSFLILFGTITTGPVTVKVSGVNFTTTSTSLVNVTGLTFPVAANTLYEVDVLLRGTMSTSAGGRFSIACTASGVTGEYMIAANRDQATSDIGPDYNVLGTTCTNSQWIVSSSQDCLATFKATVKTSAGTGNITVQILKTTNGTATVYVGSRMTVTPLT